MVLAFTRPTRQTAFSLGRRWNELMKTTSFCGDSIAGAESKQTGTGS